MRSVCLCASKKILVAGYTVTILLTLITVALFLLTDKDVTPVAGLAALAWAATGTDTAFYYRKATVENRIKITYGMIEKLADKYGMDAVIQVAGIALGE